MTLGTRGAGRPVFVIDTPPTPNGDLHVGHIAGPLLAADVYARYLRSVGRPVVYSTGSDNSQTYVLASARKRGTTPEELCEQSRTSMERTLHAMALSVDGFAPYDEGYVNTVLDFLRPLYEAGRFELRTVRLPYSERTGEFLVEGLVAGDCPVCLSESRGGLCETCGHPNNFDELIDPRSTVDPTDRATTREAQILVLPMENYREELTAYYDQHGQYLRPHMRQLVRELLSRPLPDCPMTYPIGWGIPAPFPETPGQVLNAWIEGIPAVMFCTEHAARQMGEPPRPTDELWRAEHDAEVVYFIGFDNVWFWGLTHLALLMAHEGRYVLPAAMVCNEFYELENEKFSTSKGHVLYCEDLLTEVPRDLIRFYLALACPANQRTNFSRAALDKVTRERLVEPWDRLAGVLGKAVAEAGVEGAALPVSAAARTHAARMIERFVACYEARDFSLTRAADLIVVQLERLLRWASELDDAAGLDEPSAAARRERLGDLFLEVKALVACAAPILADLADAAGAVGGYDGVLSPEAFDVARVTAFALPSFRPATVSAG